MQPGKLLKLAAERHLLHTLMQEGYGIIQGGPIGWVAGVASNDRCTVYLALYWTGKCAFCSGFALYGSSLTRYYCAS